MKECIIFTLNELCKYNFYSILTILFTYRDGSCSTVIWIVFSGSALAILFLFGWSSLSRGQ